MSVKSSSCWPQNLPRHLPVPATNLYYNVEVSAARYPNKPFIIFYDTAVTFAEFKDETERIAGFLQRSCGVKAGDRVLLYMQNSPQWMLSYYGILRANAVVVPVNPMNITDELRHYIEDSGARTAFAAQDLYERIAQLVGEGDERLANIIVATYSDYLKQPSRIAPPEFISAHRNDSSANDSSVVHWRDMLEARFAPGPLIAGSDDLCVMPYTSGTTGKPKGCMHTHRSVMSTAVGYVNWLGGTQSSVLLSALPLFHVTGMQSGMNAPLFSGATVVVLPRWDRDAAARAIACHRVTEWHSISTMAVDFLSNPHLSDYDLSSLRVMSGGGASMPDAVARKLEDITGIKYIEGYGMSETIAPTHVNPPQRPKSQCLGIPIFDVDSRIVDPETLTEVPQGEIGEIVTHGPQVMQGYWRNPEATREAFVEIDGKRFLRSGDLARKDEDGYFFMVDRLKRMINASGYKVWPAEVETMMYYHPAIREVCVIAARDAHRGETVKAFVVRNEKHADAVTEEDIVTWARENMAAYKAPRVVQFVESLPKSGSGKIMWRLLQDQETTKSAG